MEKVFDVSNCYKQCNAKYSAVNPNRIYCKKGCDQEGDVQECKDDYCTSLCFKQELGEDESKLGKVTSIFSRAPTGDASAECLFACSYGCNYRDQEENGK